MCPMQHTFEVYIYVCIYIHFLYIRFEIQPLCFAYLRDCKAYRYFISKEFVALGIPAEFYWE